MKLSPKHKSFCDQYLSNGMNATQAYKSVYKVSDKVAGTGGPRLMENVGIQEYIQKEQNKISEKLEIKKEDLIRDLIKIKNDNIEDSPPFSIKAIEVINKMMGFDAPIKQDITITEQPLFLDDDLVD